MSKALTEAIHALTDVAAAQLHELQEANKERRAQRWRDPEFLAEVAAQRAPLRHTTFAGALQSPALAIPFTKEIPAEFWAQAADGLAEVSCPCGETPRLKFGAPATCDCDRAFLYTGKAVLVAVFEHDPDYVDPTVD